MPYQPRATLDNPYGPQITFRTEDVLPPGALYISPEDRITIWLMTDLLAQTISIELRMLMPTGLIQLIPYQFPPQGTYTWSVAFELPPWEGYLLGALCWSSSPQRGQCFVSVQVVRSAPAAQPMASAVIMQGYVSKLNVLSYPTSPVESTFSGHGAFITITPANVTGTNMLIFEPPFTLWRVAGMNFSFNTSAAAGNRQMTIVAKDINNVQWCFWQSTFQQPPSTGYSYAFSPGNGDNQTGIAVNIAAPSELYLANQSSLQTFVFGLDAADVISGMAMMVEEWMGA